MSIREYKYFTANDTETPLTIRRYSEHPPIEPHYHDFYELVVVLQGTGIHFINSEEYPIMAGNSFLITPNSTHGYRDTKDLDIANILYIPERLQLPQLDIDDIPGHKAFFELEPKMRKLHNFKSSLRLSPANLAKTEYLIEAIQKELNSEAAGRHYMATALFMSLKGFLARCYEEVVSAEGRTVVVIADLIGFMEKNYQKELTLDQLAKIAKMSKSTLNRTFKQATGTTPIDHFIEIRIKKAAELLRTRRFNVTEAAFEVGFNDSNYFIRQFKEKMGITPKRYLRVHMS